MMRAPLVKTFSFFLGLYLTSALGIEPSAAGAASPTAALLKAKKEAEAKGYIFEVSREDIVAKAKKEAKLRVVSTLESSALKAVRDAFKRKYPFIDLRVEELGSVEENQRFLLEIKAGTAKGWDVNR